ncbi:hypothetical protein DYD21_19520 [Rhodohalobacter sp. SW132]|uniref:sulfotransferase n=1 Tax=Rhodohalobacter sp. SW132 TaxID=2293433 RepID=UPI000E24933F|nr:sulfotransferase [Rhodohalobacter sp. SW132]REL24171.1 hypothetical protein DYD21_19520 [Rhodohalobacter sp. SW132]
MIRRINGKLQRTAFSLAGNIGSCAIEDTIVLAGSPRSGTTLLLEAMHKLPGYKAINEPLLKKKIRKKHGFNLRSYIAPGQSVPDQKKFLSDVLQGQMDQSARWLFEAQSVPGRIFEHSQRDKLLVKFCRINRMLPWFAEQFDVRGIVFIVRHPCAVVNSMLRFGQWDKWTWEYVQKDSVASPTVKIDHLPDSVQDTFAPLIERISTKTEALTLMWCLDHYLPLLHSSEHPWILVPYEKLITHNHSELRRICNALGAEVNNDILQTLDKPSSSVKEKVKENADAQLLKWKQQLTTKQIDDILYMVDAVNLTSIYTDAAEPNYEYLNTLQRQEITEKVS